MNNYTLKFLDQKQERIFSIYMIQEQKNRLLMSTFLSFIFSGALGIVELIKSNTSVGYRLIGLSIVNLAMYWAIKTCIVMEHYLFIFLSFQAYLMPFVFLFAGIEDSDISTSDKVCMLLINNLAMQYIIVYQNFLVNLVIYFNQIVINCVALCTIFELNSYIIIYGVYALFWLRIEYQDFYDKKLKFQESKINQSLWDIIDKSARDKLVAFTYDEEHLKFNLEICNQAANKYLQMGSISQILRDITIKTLTCKVNLGKYITEQYIALNTNTRHTLKQQKLYGYYQEKCNKVKIRLYVQSVPQLKFILNLHTYKKSVNLRQGQGWLINKYQLLTVGILNNIAQTIYQTEYLPVCVNKIKNTLNTYQMKLKLLNLKKSDNYQLTCSDYDIIKQLKTILHSQSTQFIINMESYFVYSDYSLSKLLFQLIIKYLAILNPINIILDVQVVNYDTYIDITFVFNGSIPDNRKCVDKIFDFFLIILSYIGIQNSLIVTNEKLSFSIITVLGQRFQELNII